MSNILKAFLNSDNPVIMIAGSKSPVNVFQGEFKGEKYAFGMNAEVAFDPFFKGKKLNKIHLPSEIASSSLPKALDSMALSDGTKLAVTEDMSLGLSNETMYSPVSGEPVTVSYDDSISDDSETEEDIEEMEEGVKSSPESDHIPQEDSMPLEEIEEEEEPESEEMEEPESEKETPVEMEEPESEEMEEPESEEMEEPESEEMEEPESEEMEEPESEEMEEPESEEETPVDMEVEAASFVTNRNIRLVAFDSAASEIAMFAGDIHVATFIQKEAHESKRALFSKPNFLNHISILAEKANFNLNHSDFKPYGIKPVKFTVNVPELTTSLVKEITKEVASAQAEQAEDTQAKTKETLKLALVGISKGVINSSLISEIASVFEVLGIKNAQNLVAKTLHNNAESFAKSIFEEASVLATKNKDYLKGFAEVCAKANFVAAQGKTSEVASYVPSSTNFHIPLTQESIKKPRPRITVTY